MRKLLRFVPVLLIGAMAGCQATPAGSTAQFTLPSPAQQLATAQSLLASAHSITVAAQAAVASAPIGTIQRNDAEAKLADALAWETFAQSIVTALQTAPATQPVSK